MRKLGKSGRAAVTAAVLAAVSLVVAVSAFGSPAQQQKTVVAVTAGKPTEFRFTLSKRTVVKGVTVFTVTNRGAVRHDFKIAGKKTLQIAPGKSRVLTVTFTKIGKYQYLCTLPGHAPAGMKGVLTVKAP
ncbi:MAG: cupredoxin domain-containing protein [Actinobacteria bacterium]|nr:cupredoxin domain-containing protein [Actinomycetota bacterium]